jgi:hypothetical protein
LAGENSVNPETFEAADRVIDDIAEIVDSTLLSAEVGKLQEALTALAKAVGPRYSANLSVIVDVFDEAREKSLPLLNTGLSVGENGEPYRTWGDSTPQRYLVNGEIEVVPHDHCPHCWEIWDFKFQNHSCEYCGAKLGRECRILLDSDVCPSCEKGRVTMTKPLCDKCGFKVDPSFVAWG